MAADFRIHIVMSVVMTVPYFAIKTGRQGNLMSWKQTTQRMRHSTLNNLFVADNVAMDRRGLPLIA